MPDVRHLAGALPRQVTRAAKFEYYAFWRRRPIETGTVLYESFSGNGALCNPEALFRELLATPDLAPLRHTWVLSSTKENPAIVAEFASDPRVSFVGYRSPAYYRALATHQYLINNATFPFEFSKRDGQTYLNTWHGTPLKAMGYDMPGGGVEAANTLRNFVAADFLLAANPFMTEQMYEKAYKLDGVFRGLIVEEGYPRIDLQFADDTGLARIRDTMTRAGVDIGDRSIVLYAPTWKGTSFANPDDDVRALLATVTELQSRLGPERVVLLKTHQIVHRFAAHDPVAARFLVPNEIPANAVLAVTDALITDYSSIFFDYLQSGRPVVFSAPDIEDYTSTRGLYFEPETWPGPVCATVGEVAEAVASELSGPPTPWQAVRDSWQARFAATEDGQTSRRVVDVVFRGARDGYRVRALPASSKTTLLLHLGGMRSNGITTSVLNLLEAVDTSRFDVSVVYPRPGGVQQIANAARIPSTVRQFPRVGGMNGSKLTHLVRKVAERRGHPGTHQSTVVQQRLWDDEWTRCFGDSRFDLAVDFSGYSAFWATLLLHSPESTRSIWLHNDMQSEVNRPTDARAGMTRSLPALFTLYREFDHLVSVSPSLARVNENTLAGYGSHSDHFGSARNLLDGEHVLAGARENLLTLDGHDAAASGWVPRWAGGGVTRFVSVGRFSTEKNQVRLLRAFSRVHRADPDTMLVIVGYGPLRDTLEREILSLGLGGAAHLAGPYQNPYPIMAAADCFVLSSDYEGQPMVILEAAVLGLPIITVDFASAADALPGSELRIVPQTVDALAGAMADYLRGEVLPSSIDVAHYNRLALAEFERAIEGPVLREILDSGA